MASKAVVHNPTLCVTARKLDGVGMPWHDFRYIVTFKDLVNGSTRTARAKFIIVTTGILGLQYTLQERGYKGMQDFKGILTLAGRHNGRDSIIGTLDCTKKVCSKILVHCKEQAPSTTVCA